MAGSLSSRAAHTPAARNRVVDLIRALAICVVVLGHWLMAGLYVDADGALHRTGLLSVATWAHPLTWVLQVIPLVFLVGGYANALSWQGAQRRGTTYGGWLRARLRRLVTPVLPLMVFWLLAPAVAGRAGLGHDWLRIAGKASLVPTWFLANYLVVVMLVPATWWLWQRWGWACVVVAVGLAGVVDLLSISGDAPALGLLNALFVWGTAHQLGYAWLTGGLAHRGSRLLLAGVGVAGLVLLVRLGPYGVSMVGVNGYGLDNARPPRVTLAFLALAQAGVTLMLEPVLRRAAERPRVWLVTVAINGRVMTIYLWHLTALGIAAGAAMLHPIADLRLVPNSGGWWATRPLWILLLVGVTALLVVGLGRFEELGADLRPVPPGWMPVVAALLTAAALLLLADHGIVDASGHLSWHLVAIPLVANVALGTIAAFGALGRLGRLGTLGRTRDDARARREVTPRGSG
ncbi:acyltransferase family protein [Myroides odoratimimus subsp. xuanwuensis]